MSALEGTTLGLESDPRAAVLQELHELIIEYVIANRLTGDELTTVIAGMLARTCPMSQLGNATGCITAKVVEIAQRWLFDARPAGQA